MANVKVILSDIFKSNNACWTKTHAGAVKCKRESTPTSDVTGTKTEDGWLQCSECTRSFRSEQALRCHKAKAHRRLEVFACDFCHRKFSRRSQLRKHLRRMHRKQLKKQKDCAPERSVKKPAAALKSAEAARTGSNSLTCNVCGFHFKNKANSVRHFNEVHLRLRPFRCKLCKLRFARKFVFDQHMARQHKRKPQ